MTYQDAIIGPEYEKWLEAMESEMESMYTNQIWTLVDPPEGVKPIGYKWVFKNKTDMDGKVNTFKERLVAKCFKKIFKILTSQETNSLLITTMLFRKYKRFSLFLEMMIQVEDLRRILNW